MVHDVIFFVFIYTKHVHKHANLVMQPRILAFCIQSFGPFLLKLELKPFHRLAIFFQLLVQSIYFTILPKKIQGFELDTS